MGKLNENFHFLILFTGSIFSSYLLSDVHFKKKKKTEQMLQNWILLKFIVINNIMHK